MFLLLGTWLNAEEVTKPDLTSMQPNKWTPLAGGKVNSYANPMYDSETKTMVILQGNGIVQLDPATGAWKPALSAKGGSSSGDQPLMKRYTLKDGRPSFKNMLLYHMTAWDSKRKRLIAGATQFMAAYDSKTHTWADLKATVSLAGKTYPGVPPVAWGSMCYDPINDEIVMLSGGAIYNFDNWEKDKEVIGTFGTFVYDCKKNTWARPLIGSASFDKARRLLRPVHLALQVQMSKAGEAIVLTLNDDHAAATKLMAVENAAISKIAGDLKKLAASVTSLENLPRLASASAKISQAAAALKSSGTPEEIYRAEFEAYRLLVAARDEDLWSHPHPRALARMVYVPDQKAILVFGGSDGYRHLNDTWVYDCTKKEWSKKNPKTVPRPREMHVMVYDSNIKKIVMAGGYTSFWAQKRTQLLETWIYDFEKDDWQLVLKAFPFKRGFASYFAEYHQASKAIILVRGKETFALKLQPGEVLPAPTTTAFPVPEDKTPFLPPKDDPEVLARWKAIPANTWVPADAPRPETFAVGSYGWGMMGFNGRMHCAQLWGGGHSTHQANDIALYFPGANKWISGYPAHRINLAPWNKGCGNPGGVDLRGGVYNLHARRGLGGNGTRALITIQCFSPYFYGPEAFMKQPTRWGKSTTFEFDYFARRWRMPCPTAMAAGMCYPYNAKDTVMAVNVNGAQYYDREKNTWEWASKSKCPGKPSGGEGASNLYIEKKNMVMVIGPSGKNKPVETWALDISTGVWKNLKPNGAPPGRPSALAYCEKDDALFAGCFTGFGKKPLQGQEAIYSFKKNKWIIFPSKVQPRVLKKGQPYRPTTIGGYHNAWSKIAHSPKHNLIMRHAGGGGMWVMRPNFSKVKWNTK